MEINLDFSIDNKELEFQANEILNLNIPKVQIAQGTIKFLNDRPGNIAVPIEHGLGKKPKMYWIMMKHNSINTKRYYAGQIYNQAFTGWHGYEDKVINPIFFYNQYAETISIYFNLFPQTTEPDDQYIYLTPIESVNTIASYYTYEWGAIYWDD